ncbi:MAG: hypothetical protein D6766_09590, partial [Verrucomicrobia bacterium]
FAGGDADWYRVYVRTPGPLAFSLEAVPENNRPRLRLYDANGEERATWVNTNPGVGGEDLIVYEVPAPGFYHLRVTDEDGRYATEPYTLRVTGADFSRAPLLAPIGDRTIDETVPFALTLDASDPDNPEDLVYSASNLPPGASFDPATRTFRWTPSRGQAGVYAGVHFEVSDGVYTDSEDITITVNRLSRPPVLNPIGDKMTAPGVELRFQIAASDPDREDVLTFAASGLPSGATFDPATGTFAWTPGADQIGVYRNVFFSVTDGTWTDFESITIEVVENVDPCAAWLAKHFTEAERANPDLSGMDADPDHDGATNAEECEADTDPRSAESVLRITGLEVVDGQVTIHWQGGRDAVQHVERKRALDGTPGGWEVIHTVTPPTPLENSYTDTLPGEVESYYRIRAERP